MTSVLEQMKIRVIAPWFGGKRNMAPLITTAS